MEFKLQPSKKLGFVKKKFYQTHNIAFFINVGHFYLSYFYFNILKIYF